MDINDKKLKRTSKIINWTISIVLAVFLILLSNLIIDDLDNMISYPDYNAYIDQRAVDNLDSGNSALYDQIQAFRETQANYRKMQDLAISNKEAEQESFDNWVKTRNSIGSPNQDKEVLQRTRKIDEYRSISQEWGLKVDSIQSQIDGLQKQILAKQQDVQLINEEAGRKHDSAMKSYDLKVFLVRLLFTAPILALGIFFFLRYRNHKFMALFMGFSLFSVYVFFFGLVPYLPSYGGYIRYAVGILLTMGLGYYAIKRLKNYSDQKKAELKESTTERAKKLQNEITERAFNNHICPSCGKDFLMKSWEVPTQINRQGMHLATDYCRFCGLQLIKKCPDCSQSNYAHLPFCTSCGTNIK